MVKMETPLCDFGAAPVDFNLRGVDGGLWTLDRCRGPRGLLVMFICNHCPYVIGARDRIIRDARDLKALGVGVVAINSNDPISYPEDSFENMQNVAREHAYPFPYLYDQTQEVARASVPFARRISSATTRTSSSSTGGGSTMGDVCSLPQAQNANYSRV